MRQIETRAVISAADRTGNVFAAVAAKARMLETAQRTMARTSSSSMATFSRGLAAVGGAAAIVAGAKESLLTFAELEKTVTQLGITGEVSGEKVAAAMAAFRQIGPKLGSTPVEVAKAAETYVAAGLDFDVAVKSMEATLRTAKASGSEVADISQAGTALLQNFKLNVDELQSGFDKMSKGSKLGSLEMRDMARQFPSVGAAAARVGLTGQEGLAKTIAMLETIRKVVPSGEEAANRYQNVVQKIFLDTTAKNFKKYGIDYQKFIGEQRKKGVDAITATLTLIEQLTKGKSDSEKQFIMGRLFNDMQAQEGLQAMAQFKDEMLRMYKEIREGSKGVISTDLARVAETTANKIDKLSASWENLKGKLGQKLSGPALTVIDGLNQAVDLDFRLQPGENGGTIPQDPLAIPPWPGERERSDAEYLAANARQAAVTDRDRAVARARELRDQAMKRANFPRTIFGPKSSGITYSPDASTREAFNIETAIAGYDAARARVEAARRAMPRMRAMPQGGETGAGPVGPGLASFGLRGPVGGGMSGTFDPGKPVATLEGQVLVSGKITVEPSPLLLATIDQRIQAVGAHLNANGAGSVGRSMPEAAAPRHTGRGDL